MQQEEMPETKHSLTLEFAISFTEDFSDADKEALIAHCFKDLNKEALIARCVKDLNKESTEKIFHSILNKKVDPKDFCSICHTQIQFNFIIQIALLLLFAAQTIIFNSVKKN